MASKPIQLFGTVEVVKGAARAMLCIDADQPQQYMVHTWGYEGPVALLFDATDVPDGIIELRPRNLYRPAENGALFLPTLTDEEKAAMRAMSARLTQMDGGLVGEWRGADGVARPIKFNPEPAGGQLAAAQCATWADFKQWATQSRLNVDAALFRGHGSSAFRLQTTLHRAGRCRLERYCAETLQQFHGQVEAELDIRLNMNDGVDYSVVLGLGQHHGLPTPLLDWTESPYIAAFFAFADALEMAASRPDTTHVRIFALTRRFVDEASPPHVVLPFMSPYACGLGVAPRHNRRLLAQQGRFLVTNMVNLEGYIAFLEEQVGDRLLCAVDLPISAATEALEDLAFMGVTAATLFPGLDGICRTLKHQMAFTRAPIREAGKPTGDAEQITTDGGVAGKLKQDDSRAQDQQAPGAPLQPPFSTRARPAATSAPLATQAPKDRPKTRKKRTGTASS